MIIHDQLPPLFVLRHYQKLNAIWTLTLTFPYAQGQQVLDGFITYFSVNQQKLLDAVLSYQGTHVNSWQPVTVYYCQSIEK
jgi:hypothetical protein